MQWQFWVITQSQLSTFNYFSVHGKTLTKVYLWLWITSYQLLWRQHSVCWEVKYCSGYTLRVNDLNHIWKDSLIYFICNSWNYWNIPWYCKMGLVLTDNDKSMPEVNIIETERGHNAFTDHNSVIYISPAKMTVQFMFLSN